MAFFSKVGGILRQTASRQINADSASRPSIFQAIRCMSSSKLFVGGLSYSTDEQSLREAFSKYGYVAEARVIVDRETGRSRGFGFVTYGSAEEASSAIQALDGQDLHGRRVRVNYATDRARGGGFGGGGGGSYGGGFGAGYGGDNAGYGGGNYGGGGNYNSNYGGGNASYGGTGNYPAGNTGGYGGNYGVAGGGGGADSGFDGNTGGFGGGSDSFNVAAGGSSPDGVANQFGGGDESGSFGGEAGGFNQDGPLEGNYRDDDDDDAGNFAKRA